MKKGLTIFIILIVPLALRAQFGGERSFEFINLPANARVAGLGGVNVSHSEASVDGFLSNPALLDSVSPGAISVSHLGFVADVRLSNVAYAHKISRIGVVAFGIQYMSFGKIDGYDAAGFEEGSFNANEFALITGYSHRLGPFILGANLKFAGSGIGSYKATALMVDIGGQFKHPSREFALGMVFKNLGFYLSDYTGTADSRMPFDIRVGMTFKPQYMPVRFSLSAYNLYQGNLTVFDPDSDFTLVSDEAGGFDKAFRHIAIGTEFIFTRNLHLRAGYNHLIRKELRLDAKSGGAGFSFGFLVRVKKFELAYSRAIYHIAGGGNYFTIGTNLNSVIKKRTKT